MNNNRRPNSIAESVRMRGGNIENHNHKIMNNLITGEYGLVSTPLNGRREGNMF
jgi:hypothetical protein